MSHSAKGSLPSRILPKSTVARIKIGFILVLVAWLHFFTPSWADGLYDYVKYFVGMGLLLWAVTFTRTVRFGVLLLYSIFGAFTYFLVWAFSLYLTYRGEEFTFTDGTAVLVGTVVLFLLPLYFLFFHSASGRTANLVDGFALGSFSGLGYLFVQIYQEQLARGPILAIPPGSWTTTIQSSVMTATEPEMIFYAGAIAWAGILGFGIAVARRLRTRAVWWVAVPVVLGLYVAGEVVSYGYVVSNTMFRVGMDYAQIRERIGVSPEQAAELDTKTAAVERPANEEVGPRKEYLSKIEDVNREVLTPEQFSEYSTLTRASRFVETFYSMDGSGRGASRVYMLCFLLAVILGETYYARMLAKFSSLRVEGEPASPTALSELHLLQSARRGGWSALTAVDRFVAARRRLCVIAFDADGRRRPKDADRLVEAATERVNAQSLLVTITREGQPLPEPADGDKGVSWTRFTSGLVFTLVMAFVSMKLIVLLGVFFARNLGDVPAAYMYAAAVAIALGYLANYFRLSIAKWGSALGQKLLALFGWRLDD